MTASPAASSPITGDREKAATPALSLPENKEEIFNNGLSSTDNTATSPSDQIPPYSIFTLAHKRAITWQTSFSAIFSGLTSFIYYPAITALSDSLRVSVAAINLTVAAYLIVAGIAPSLLGDISDQKGRRPVSLLALTLYLAANLGLALQNSYPALVALRCLQSAGSAGTIAIAHGVISDITRPAERGWYVGVLFGFTNASPNLGPILGGVITQKLSWRWIFWLLTILSGCQLAGLLIFFPETSRKLVGNGSITPRHWLNRSFVSMYKARKNKQQYKNQQSSPFSGLEHTSKTLLHPETHLPALPRSSKRPLSSPASCLGTSISTEMAGIYGLSPLMTGLLYLPSGIGGLIASLQTGKLLDYHYAVVARALERSVSASLSSPITPDRNSTTTTTIIPAPVPAPFPPPGSQGSNSHLYPDLTHFPIERARLRSIAPFLLIASLSTLGYGWSLQSKTHIAIPLLMQFLSGSAQIAIFVIIGTLLTDLNPGRSSTAQAAYSIVRCGLAAAGVAVLRPVIERVGVGWCFTGAVGLSVLCVPLLGVLWVRGWGWRRRGGRGRV